MTELVPLMIGGLILFLFSISRLSSVLKEIFSDKVRGYIERYTKNLFLAIIIGTLLTILLDSSSAVIILAIIFINAGVLTFKNTMGLILGANIGTTFSSQIIAMDLGQYSIIPLALGFIFMLFGRTEKQKRNGSVLFYLGMLFFGMFIIEHSVLPLKENPQFATWMEQIDGNHWYGALVGAIVTLVLQSSSGTVGMSIILGNQEVISAAAGISIMLGAELGTCANTIIATINGTRQAVKAGIFHLIFNLSTIILGLSLFRPFLKLVTLISSNNSIGTVTANAHVAFNLIGVLIFLPLIGLLGKLLNKALPDSKRMIVTDQDH